MFWLRKNMLAAGTDLSLYLDPEREMYGHGRYEIVPDINRRILT